MEPGHRRTIIARVVACFGTLCGANARHHWRRTLVGLDAARVGNRRNPVGTDCYLSSV